MRPSLHGKRSENLSEFMETTEIEMAVLLSFIFLRSQIKAFILPTNNERARSFLTRKFGQRNRTKKQNEKSCIEIYRPGVCKRPVSWREVDPLAPSSLSVCLSVSVCLSLKWKEASECLV